jgi:ABC-type lipoprotein export system ATPase subunit
MSDFVLEIKEVTWHGEKGAFLERASLGLSPGECVGVRAVGDPSEEGLFRIFSTLETPEEGRVRFNGADVRFDAEHELSVLRRQLAYLPRIGVLVSNLTLLENITLFQRYHFNWAWKRARDYAAPLIDRFGIGSYLDMRPSEVDNRNQRLAVFARELLKECRVVLVEDLHSHLSVKDVRAVVDHLHGRKDREGTAVLVFEDGSDVPDPLVDRRVEIRGGAIFPVHGTPTSNAAEEKP